MSWHHVIPVNDRIEHISNAQCMCRPTYNYDYTVTHHAIDNREFNEIADKINLEENMSNEEQFKHPDDPFMPSEQARQPPTGTTEAYRQAVYSREAGYPSDNDVQRIQQQLEAKASQTRERYYSLTGTAPVNKNDSSDRVSVSEAYDRVSSRLGSLKDQIVELHERLRPVCSQAPTEMASQRPTRMDTSRSNLYNNYVTIEETANEITDVVQEILSRLEI